MMKKDPNSRIREIFGEHLIACICEGGTENTYIRMFLENKVLIFDETQLLEEEPVRERSIKNFEKKFMGKSFNKKLVFLRILDSRGEEFKICQLSKVNQKRVADVVNVYTRPEIEMILICAEDIFEDYHQYVARKKGSSGTSKPSEYCKEVLGLQDCKRPVFLEQYFSDPEKLIRAICRYGQKMGRKSNDEFFLSDLLKPDCRACPGNAGHNSPST